MIHSQPLTCAAAFALLVGAPLIPAQAGVMQPEERRYVQQDQSSGEQGEARRDMKAGRSLSLREIERRVLPKMRGSEYLGPSYDAVAHAYRLKFIKDGRVSYVDVDARTGRIIKRSR